MWYVFQFEDETGVWANELDPSDFLFWNTQDPCKVAAGELARYGLEPNKPFRLVVGPIDASALEEFLPTD